MYRRRSRYFRVPVCDVRIIHTGCAYNLHRSFLLISLFLFLSSKEEEGNNFSCTRYEAEESFLEWLTHANHRPTRVLLSSFSLVSQYVHTCYLSSCCASCQGDERVSRGYLSHNRENRIVELYCATRARRRGSSLLDSSEHITAFSLVSFSFCDTRVLDAPTAVRSN